MTPRPWTTAEERRLREAYGRVPVPELAQELGRTACAIYQRAYTLKLGQRSYKHWTTDELRLVDEILEPALREVMRRTGRNPMSIVWTVVKKFGPNFGKTPKPETAKP